MTKKMLNVMKWSWFNFKLGVLWSSQVTITNIKGESDKRCLQRFFAPCDSGRLLPRTPQVRWFPLHEDHRGPTPRCSCLSVYWISHMCASVVVLCALDSHYLVCVCPTGLVLANSSFCSPLLLSKPFVSVRCFCFDAFFLPLHLNCHPAQWPTI